MSVRTEKPLKDTIQVHNQTVGDFEAFIVYEIIHRICMFCSTLGHDHTSCLDKVRMQRLQRLQMDPKYKNRLDMKNITENKVSQWIINSAYIPLIDNQNMHIPHHNATPNTNHTLNIPNPNTNMAIQGVDLNQHGNYNQSEIPVRRSYTTRGQSRTTSFKRMGHENDEAGGSGIGEETQTASARAELVHANKKRIVEASLGPSPPIQ